MTKTAVITLPWPDKALWQNTPSHYFARARATRKARNDAWLLASTRWVKALPRKCVEFHLHFFFSPPNRLRRDVSNCIAACKAYVDGIADALGVDDSEFRIHWPTRWEPIDPEGGGPYIAVRIEAKERECE